MTVAAWLAIVAAMLLILLLIGALRGFTFARTCRIIWWSLGHPWLGVTRGPPDDL